MQDLTAELEQHLNLDVIEMIELGPREQVLHDVPGTILGGPLRDHVRSLFPHGQLWRHQSLALTELLRGSNTVVATGTASGKSLIFQSFALHLIKSSPNTRVLVFYPLKSLAADQYQRWLRVCADCGLGAGAVARIDGDVLGPDRDEALSNARIILMTPDVCQAWLMRNAGSSLGRVDELTQVSV